MSKRKIEINNKYFDRIDNPIKNILKLLKNKSKLKERKKELVEMNRNIRKNIYKLSLEIQQYEDEIEKILSDIK